jgi:hypothetical protein
MPARDLQGRFSRLHGKGSFAANIDTLATQAEGSWQGKVEVDQIYAHYQHEHPEFHHPDGGEAFYLQRPLYEDIPEMFSTIARKALTAEGVNLDDAIMEAMEHLSLQVFMRAPIEFGDLKASGHPQVWHNGARVKNREPNLHRLSEDELRAKSEVSRLLWPNRYRHGEA